MRLALLGLVAMVAACSDHYGAYFTVDGHDAISFDRVEFYFGHNAGTEVPVPPGRLSLEPEPGLLVRRLVVDSDTMSLPSPAGSLTYFVPHGGENDELGDYLLVIAYSGSTPVGIGELFDFTVPTDSVVYKYPIALLDYASEDIELWGRPTPDCIRWKRDRGSRPGTVGMVRDNDVDCDAFVDRGDAAADCEPLRYCDGGGDGTCVGATACFIDDSGCRLGMCQNKDGQSASCTPTTCALDQACSDCDINASSREVLGCMLFDNNVHVDYLVTVKPSQALCTVPYKLILELPPGVTCQNPKVEAVMYYTPAEAFDFQIVPSSGTACALVLTPPAPDTVLAGDPHVMISIDSPGGPASRQMFIFGLQTVVDLCSNQQTVIVEPSTVGCLP